MDESLNVGQVSKGVNSPEGFMESLKAQKMKGSHLDQMIENNITRVTTQSIQTAEADDLSAMGQAYRLLKTPKKTGDVLDEVKRVYEMRAKVFARKDDADGFADQFSRRDGNKEYHLDPLVLGYLAYEDLGVNIHENSTAGDILRIIERRMADGDESADPAIINKGFEFLIEVSKALYNSPTTPPARKEILSKISSKIQEAKDQYFGIHVVEIEVGDKIIGAVDAVVNATGLSVKETLNRYRDVVHNPPDLQTLRKYYEQAGGYKSMKRELEGLNRYLNVNFKRSGLENAELGQLAKSARKMQALIHVFSEADHQCKTFLKGYVTSNDLIAPAA